MAEILSEHKTPEQRVFGNAFSLDNGAADEETRKKFFEERVTTIKEGQTAWLPRTLDSERGVVADLMIGGSGRVVATLVFDYDVNTANVYTTSDGGEFGDTTLCDQVSFDEAVTQAEHFAKS